jgi:hypothetical protein
MPENIGVANLCEFFDELAAMVLQTLGEFAGVVSGGVS